MPKAQKHFKLQCFGFWTQWKTSENNQNCPNWSLKKAGGGSSFLELSPARLWPHLPKRARIRTSPTPARLASLRFAYTYTQHRPSAGFRNIEWINYNNTLTIICFLISPMIYWFDLILTFTTLWYPLVPDDWITSLQRKRDVMQFEVGSTKHVYHVYPCISCISM